MRNFKLLLTALLLTLVWGFSFSSADTIDTILNNSDIIKHFSYNINVNNNAWYIQLVNANNRSDSFCLRQTKSQNIIDWFPNTRPYVNFWFAKRYGSDAQSKVAFYLDAPINKWFCFPWVNAWRFYYEFQSTWYSWLVEFDYFYLSELLALNWGSDCSSIQSSLNQCQSDLSSCTNSCDTLVSQCQSDKETLQTSYSGCIETNSSLQNYNDSLALQLQECIEQWTWFSGATIINLYDMFRSDWINDYSLPITNNIKLPYWYRGFLDDWVLAIKNIYTLENAYSFDDDSFQNWVIENFWKVFLFFMSCGLTLVFLYAIRRYFIWLKSIK